MRKKYPYVLQIPLTVEQLRIIEQEAAERDTTLAGVGRAILVAHVRKQQQQQSELVAA
jgi:hypothetical protein